RSPVAAPLCLQFSGRRHSAAGPTAKLVDQHHRGVRRLDQETRFVAVTVQVPDTDGSRRRSGLFDHDFARRVVEIVVAPVLKADGALFRFLPVYFEVPEMPVLLGFWGCFLMKPDDDESLW